MRIGFEERRLERLLGIWSKAIAARGIARFTRSCDHHALAAAMEEFPGEIEPLLRLMLEEIQDDDIVYVDTAPGTLTVTLDGFGATTKISVIKAVREITGLGLKEAKDLVEAAPKPVKEVDSEEEAMVITRRLEEAGGKVSVGGRLMRDKARAGG